MSRDGEFIEANHTAEWTNPATKHYDDISTVSRALAGCLCNIVSNKLRVLIALY